MRKEDVELLNEAVMCADWGLQMERDNLNRCYDLIYRLRLSACNKPRTSYE